MTSEALPPIPNESALIYELRKQWAQAGGTNAYRRGITVQVSIVNGRKARRVEVTATSFGDFPETYSATG